jgi:hypothetical protein
MERARERSEGGDGVESCKCARVLRLGNGRLRVAFI